MTSRRERVINLRAASTPSPKSPSLYGGEECYDNLTTYLTRQTSTTSPWKGTGVARLWHPAAAAAASIAVTRTRSSPQAVRNSSYLPTQPAPTCFWVTSDAFFLHFWLVFPVFILHWLRKLKAFPLALYTFSCFMGYTYWSISCRFLYDVKISNIKVNIFHPHVLSTISRNTQAICRGKPP